jgi:hypothetical protein
MFSYRLFFHHLSRADDKLSFMVGFSRLACDLAKKPSLFSFSNLILAVKIDSFQFQTTN